MSATVTPHAAYPPGGAVIANNDLGEPTLMVGTTVPSNSGAGYGSGCIFIDRDSATVYWNAGTSASCNFDPLVIAAQGAALTAQSTTVTITDAAGTPNFTMASFTNSSAWGFAAEDELITFAYVVRNLQVRLAEVEARLEAAGIVAAN